ncbi:hypothetical protein MW887_008844 [Aspergillus wentii]|nr:hypothetical protein MW887_008844 [Aspergillus wentii]
MPCRKRRAASPVGKKTAKIHRNDSAGAVNGRGNYEDGFEDSDDNDDDDYQPDADQDESERNDSTPEEDSEEADDPPRKITVIPYKELRPLDGVEYSDTRVHRNTLLYLNDLRTNNNRAWFKSHDREFKRAMKDWESFVATLTPKIIAFDSTVPELPPRDIIFRIYRDVRFSRDQRPYKSHFSAAFSRTGRRRPFACYYLHLDPGSSYVGGGLWAPEPPTIQLLRQSIDERPEEWRRVLSSEPFTSMFLPTAQEGTEAAVKAFADVNQEGALKTQPKVPEPNSETMQLETDRVRVITQTIGMSSC